MKYLYVLLMFNYIFANQASAQNSRIDLLTNLQNVCLSKGGLRFDFFTGCQCSDGQLFQQDIQTKEISCTTAPKIEFYCSKLNCLVGADKVVPLSSERLFTVGKGVSISFATAEEQQAFEKEIQSIEYFVNWSPHNSYHTWTDLNVQVNNIKGLSFGNRSEFLRRFGIRRNNQEHNRVVNTEMEILDNHYYYASDIESAKILAGLSTDENYEMARQAFTVGDPDLPFYDLIANAYMELIGHAQNQSLPFIMSYVERGNSCLDKCRSSFALSAQGEFTEIRYQQEIMRGMQHTRFLTMISPSLSMEIIVQLGHQLYPSLILLRQWQSNDSLQITESSKIYDKSGKLIDSAESIILESDLAEWIDQQRIGINKDRPRLVFCEGMGSLTNSLRKLSGSIVTGPHLAGYGWVSSDHDWRSRAKVLTEQEYGLLGVRNFEGTFHLYATSEAALSVASDLQLMPVGTLSCLEQFESWAPNTLDAGAVVVNISLTLPYASHSEACSDHMLSKFKSELGRRMLFVISAGNDGVENPDGYGCSLKTNLPNVIVVGASDRQANRLASYSNFGNQIVDVVADGRIGELDGTSFAAPRIAALAAKIHQRYPSLTPTELKLAILIGAQFDDSLSEKTKAGAFYDFKQDSYSTTSQEAARCLSLDTLSSVKSCLGIQPPKNCQWYEPWCRPQPEQWPEKLIRLREKGLFKL